MKEAGAEPELIAIVVCDEVIRDQMTHKFTLVGLFNQVAAVSFPYRHPRLNVFVSLTNGHGESAGKLRLVSHDAEQPIVELKGRIRFPDPLAVVDMHFNLVNIVFLKPGSYGFDLYCDEVLIGSRRFRVVHRKPPHTGGDGENRQNPA